MIRDKVGKVGIVIQYCLIDDIWVDINTKALQGTMFYKMGDRLISIRKKYDDEVEQLYSKPGLLLPQQ